MSGYCSDCGCTICICKEAEAERKSFIDTPYELKTMYQAKVTALVETLIHFGGNRAASAKSLDVSIRTIRSMINDLREEEPAIYATIPFGENNGVKQGKWRGYAQE